MKDKINRENERDMKKLKMEKHRAKWYNLACVHVVKAILKLILATTGGHCRNSNGAQSDVIIRIILGRVEEIKLHTVKCFSFLK
jgi:hypothetical protein